MNKIANRCFHHLRILFIFGVCCFTTLCAQASVDCQESPAGEMLDGDSWQSFNPKLGVGILNFYLSNDDSLWLIYSDRSIANYDGLSIRELVYPDVSADDYLISIYESEQGELYTASLKSVFRYDSGDWRKIAEVQFIEGSAVHFYEADNGTIWMPHKKGLLEISGDQCKDHLEFKTGTSSLCFGDDSMWVVTCEGGDILRCSFENGTLSSSDEWRIERQGSNSDSVVNSLIYSDSNANIWYLDTDEQGGVWIRDSKTGEWKSVDLSQFGGENFNTCFLETHDGMVWIGGRGTMNQFDPVAKEWHILKVPDYPIPDSRPLLAQDKQGFLYILETGGQMLRIDYSGRYSKTVHDLHFQTETEDGSLWYIDVTGAVLVEHAERNTWETISCETIGMDTPLALISLMNGEVWCIGSHQTGAALSIFDGERWSPMYFPGFATSFAHLGAMEVADGVVYVGCGQKESEYPNVEGGILKFVRTEDGYDVIHLKKTGVPFRSWSLAYDPVDSRIWISGHGIHRYDGIAESTALTYPGKTWFWVDNIAATEDGAIWAAVWGEGVFRYQKGEWFNYNSLSGLPTNRISSIYALQDKHPILTSTNGIFRFDGKEWSPFLSERVRVFQGTGFVKESRDGSIWINSANLDWFYRGLKDQKRESANYGHFNTIRYYPDNQAPETYIDERLPESFTNTSVFLKWSAKDEWFKTQKEDLLYSYRVDGGEWTAFSKRTELDLENLGGGFHRFEVRARDMDFNVDATPAVHEFRVMLPLWQRPWFLILVLFIAVTVVLLVIIIIRQRIHHIIEIEKMKMRFFTNLSHELRTPISMMLGPVERLLETPREEDKKYLNMIFSSANRLLFLVEQLLDYRMAENGRVIIHKEKTDLVEDIRSHLEAFSFALSQNRQTLRFVSRVESTNVEMDRDNFRKILDNLVFNAMKYSPPLSQIVVNLEAQETEKKESSILLEVCDNGRGIPRNQLTKIFEPFYRVDNQQENLEQGSGVGLALVKELVSELSGQITAVSPIFDDSTNKGTRFEIVLPVFDDFEFDPGYQVFEYGGVSEPLVASIEPEPSKATDDRSKNVINQKTILLIEDNEPLAEFLKGELEGQYRVIHSSDGGVGLETARKEIPDIVICDVMLPTLNGYDICKNLKNNVLTSHIPVLFLTALKSGKHEEEGLLKGADDYMTKPVSPKLLKAKIHNFLETRQRLIEMIRREFHLIAEDVDIPDLDKQFLQKVEDLIDKNIDNEGYNVDHFAMDMGMSRSGFYKKFSALAGVSPANYLKTKRLNVAEALLKTGLLSVTDVALRVGFSDLGYFSRCFREQFNCSPSDMKKRSH